MPQENFFLRERPEQEGRPKRRNMLVDYSFIDNLEASRQQADQITAEFRNNIPGIPNEGYAGSEGFKDILMRSVTDPESLNPEEAKQVESAKANFPEFRAFAETVDKRRKQEQDGDIPKSVEPLAKAFYNLGQKITGGVAIRETEKGVAFNPSLKRLLVDAGSQMIEYAKSLTSSGGPLEEFGGIGEFSRRLSGKSLGENIQELADKSIVLRRTTKEEEEEPYQYIDRHGNLKTLDKMPAGTRIASNFIKGVVRLGPELIAGLLDDPAGFAVGFAEFPVHEMDLLVKAATGKDITINDDGNIIARDASDEDIAEAIDQLKTNPEAVAMLALMAYGVGKKGVGKYKSIKVDKLAEIEKKVAEADKVIEDTKKTVTLDEPELQKPIPKEIPKEKVDVAPETKPTEVKTEEAQAPVPKETAKASGTEVPQGQEVKKPLFESVKKMTDAELREALLKKEGMNEKTVDAFDRETSETALLRFDLVEQQKGVKEPLTTTDIARMSRAELEQSLKQEGKVKDAEAPNILSAEAFSGEQSGRKLPERYTGRLNKDFEGELKKNPVSSKQIIDKMSKDFGIQIRTKRLPRNASGVYYPAFDLIRVKDMGDFAVAAHEVAHKIDNKFRLRQELFGPEKNEKGRLLHHTKQPAWVKELKDLDYDQTKNGRRLDEGFAEFMRHFLTESMNVEQIAPKFTKRFSEWLSNQAEVKKSLVETFKLIREWRKQGAENRVQAQLDKGESIFTRIKENLKKGPLQKKIEFIDDLAMLELAEREIRNVERLDPKKIDPSTSPTMIARAVSKSASGKARQMVLDGTFDFAGNKTGIGLREVLEPIRNNSDNFWAYAYAKRAMELYKRNINPGIDYADAKFTVAKYENPTHQNSLVFRRTLDELVRFQDRVLQYAVDAGALSSKLANKMRKMNEFYIPLKRVMDSLWGTSSGGKRMADLPGVTKVIKGSGRAVKNPLESIIENVASIISIADKTRIGRTLVELTFEMAEKKKASGPPLEGPGKWVFPVKDPQRLVRISTQKIIDDLFKRGAITEEAMGAMDFTKAPEMMEFWQNSFSYFGKDNIVTFYNKNGQRKFFELHEGLYNTLKAVDQYFLPPMADLVLGRPTRLLRLGATGANPAFNLITNPQRDMVAFALQTEYVDLKGIVPSLARGYLSATPFGTESMKNMKELYKRSGADMSMFYGLDKQSIKRAVDEVLASDAKSKALNVVSHPIEAFRDVLSFSEAGPRLAEFEAAYRKGEELYGKGSAGALIMANNASSDVTVNFRRMGVYGAAINQIVPFHNAQVQGLHKFGRFAREHPIKAALKAVSALTIPTIAIWMMNKDEDWYKNMPPWEKYGYWHFRLGDNPDGTPLVIRVVRPFEWGLVFSTVPEGVLNSWYEQEPEGINQALDVAWGQVTPPILPQSIKTVAEIGANYDFFRDKPIDDNWQVMYDDPEDRFRPWTTETAKFIGKQFGLSPQMLEHVVSSNFPIGLKAIRGTEELIAKAQGKQDVLEFGTAADIPVAGKLFTRTKTNRQVRNSIEREIKVLKAKINRMKKLDRQGETDHALRIGEIKQEIDHLKEKWQGLR